MTQILVTEIETSTLVMEDYGEPFVCQHEFYHQEPREHLYMTFSGPSAYETQVPVCDDCDEELEINYENEDIYED